MDLFKLVLFFFSDIYPEVGLLGHMVGLVLFFWETSIMFSTVDAPIYIPINSARGFLFFSTYSNVFSLRSQKFVDKTAPKAMTSKGPVSVRTSDPP